MKKLGLFVSMLLLSSLFIINCGGGGGGDYDRNNPPVITIIGGQELLVGLDDVYEDPGAEAYDLEDGDLTDQIETNSTVDTSVLGVYTVTYTVTDSTNNTTVATRTVTVAEEGEQPVDPSTSIDGSTLACVPSDTDDNVSNDVSDDANEFNASKPFKKNVSTNSVDDLDSRRAQTSHNSFARLSMVMPETDANGTNVSVDEYHPIAVLYLEQVGGDYELGLGSADIPDPDNVDKVVVSLTRDNGQTWKDYNISNTTDRSSIEVLWEGDAEYEYPGHAQKPEMAISGQNIVVAWNDKFCPSGNPLNLEGNSTVGYADDLFGVNGTQGSIDYGTLDDDNITYTPYYAEFADKYVYEAPFSCIWTERGTIDPVTAEITWHAPIQLTSGTRDTNKIWLAGSAAGFALTWQEDTMGLKAGKGAGPGEGWSGATGNRGTDIWYTSIKAGVDFNASTDHDANESTREQSDKNFHYPVRITDNEQCQDKEDGQTPYCEYYCSNYPTITSTQGNQSEGNVTRCTTPDTDMLTDTLSVLDGDTGASRVALKILATDSEGEHIVVLGYEETKALKVRVTGEGDQDQGEVPTDIEVEGKSVYFESFDFNAIDDLNIGDASTILDVAMPLVSAGNIINVEVEDQNDSSNMIYENARRLVIGTQIDSCDVNETGLNLTFSILYKQSFEVQGASSDMFVRVNNGLTYNSFFALDGNDVTNVSAQALTTADSPEDYNVSWSEENLDDNTYDNGRENTFSPRIFLRGDNINIGYEYTPYETMDGEQLPGGGIFPSNFHTNLYIDGNWTGPVNITQVTDSSTSTVDARFFTTPKGSFDTTGLESDKSNPNVLFVTWGTIFKGTEADLFFKRSTDNGATWEDEQNLSSISTTLVEEKEVESFASADGKTIYNVWIQQTETLNPATITSGLDSWFGRVDYNISIIPEP